MKYVLTGLVLLTSLAGCYPDVEVGGPCEYRDVTDATEVSFVTEQVAVLEGDIETYEVPLQEFEQHPKEGMHYQVDAKLITTGSCNPISIQAVTPITK